MRTMLSCWLLCLFAVAVSRDWAPAQDQLPNRAGHCQGEALYWNCNVSLSSPVSDLTMLQNSLNLASRPELAKWKNRKWRENGKIWLYSAPVNARSSRWEGHVDMEQKPNCSSRQDLYFSCSDLPCRQSGSPLFPKMKSFFLKRKKSKTINVGGLKILYYTKKTIMIKHFSKKK